MQSKANPGLFSYTSLVHAIAGGCGSAVAMSTLYPLDTVRTRLQLEDKRTSSSTLKVLLEIQKEEGVIGLYRGLLPVIESLFCSNFVYFYTFHGLKRMGNTEKSALRDLLFGIIAGCTNVMATTPLWVVNTRIKMQGTKLQSHKQPHRIYSGLIDGIQKVWKDEGIQGLWSGCVSSLILVINPAIQFMTYEAVKNHMTSVYKTKELGSLPVFLTGALAKAVATILTYPIQLVQAKQRHGHTYEGLSQNAGILAMTYYIIRTRGFKGLFKGMEAKILQTVLTAALMFVCYEKIAAVVFSVLMGKRKLAMIKN